MTSNKEQDVLALRDRKLTSKQIARKLGLRPSEVKAIIKAGAAQLDRERAERGELPPLVGCWCDVGTYYDLIESEDGVSENNGLAVVTVVRAPRPQRYQIVSYLVDYLCLGVKDTIPPRNCQDTQLEVQIGNIYDAVDYEPAKISLQQAQAIVLGAERYAKSLGFEAYPDFNQTRAFLGEWDGTPQFKFGRDGQPFYYSGPDDDVPGILKTLEDNVGRGNFHFVSGLG